VSVLSPCPLPMCSVCEQFREVWNRLYLLGNSVRVRLFFSFVFFFLEPCIVPPTVSNGGEHVPSSYCRLIMPVLNTTNVLVTVYIQVTEVLAWVQLSFVLTSQISGHIS
jgi:hypothetical protein